MTEAEKLKRLADRIEKTPGYNARDLGWNLERIDDSRGAEKVFLVDQQSREAIVMALRSTAASLSTGSGGSIG